MARDYDQAFAVAPQSDGKVVAAGRANTGPWRTDYRRSGGDFGLLDASGSDDAGRKMVIGADWTRASQWECISCTPTTDGGVGACLSDATSLVAESGQCFFARWVPR
jgi:hypothetical protein